MTVLVTDEERMPITAAGYERRSRQLERLRTAERRRLSGLLREARGEGALDDNPMLVDLLDEQAQLEQRIGVLEAQLAAVEIVSPPSDGRADVGGVVRVRDTASGEVLQFELVGPIEGDPAGGRVSIAAPIGRALIGQRRGSRVDVATPRGNVLLEVLDVATALPRAADMGSRADGGARSASQPWR
ncbi:MAG TPA: GreA/GreB family elongation factor [Gaiellaceae bacterium]|nr:GreA/GreB family elongation factor [Gaiellaceae bacterium]